MSGLTVRVWCRHSKNKGDTWRANGGIFLRKCTVLACLGAGLKQFIGLKCWRVVLCTGWAKWPEAAGCQLLSVCYSTNENSWAGSKKALAAVDCFFWNGAFCFLRNTSYWWRWRFNGASWSRKGLGLMKVCFKFEQVCPSQPWLWSMC